MPSSKPRRRPSATTRCCASSTTPAKPWPACCATGQRRVEHHRRPHHRARPGPGADPRRRTATAPDILIRTDSAGCQPRLPRPHPRPARAAACDSCFSVGAAITEPVRDARSAPALDWMPAVDTDGDLRDGAEIAEITHLRRPGRLPATAPGSSCAGNARTPARSCRLFDTIDGLRHQVFATDTPRGGGSLQLPRSPPPRPRPRRRPHPLRQGHRLRPVPVPPVRHQPRLARTRPDRHRPARLDPAPCSWTANSPSPNRRSCATGCCTSPPASSAPPDEPPPRIAQRWPWASDLATAFARLDALPRPSRLTDTHRTVYKGHGERPATCRGPSTRRQHDFHETSVKDQTGPPGDAYRWRGSSPLSYQRTAG